MVLCQKHFQNKKDTRGAVFCGTAAPPGSATDYTNLFTNVVMFEYLTIQLFIV